MGGNLACMDMPVISVAPWRRNHRPETGSGIRVNMACVNAPDSPVTVIRPFIPEPGWPGVKFHIGVLELLARQAVQNLRSLGSLDGVSIWEAEWVSSPLDVLRTAVGGRRETVW